MNEALEKQGCGAADLDGAVIRAIISTESLLLVERAIRN